MGKPLTTQDIAKGAVGKVVNGYFILDAIHTNQNTYILKGWNPYLGIQHQISRLDPNLSVLAEKLFEDDRQAFLSMTPNQMLRFYNHSMETSTPDIIRASQVALKCINMLGNVDDVEIERFAREGNQLGVEFDHPNIIKVHGWSRYDRNDENRNFGRVKYSFENDGDTIDVFDPVQVMEFVETIPVNYIISGELTVTQIGRIALQASSALSYAHSKGVIHRDVKPANLAVNPSFDLKMLDFGIALDIGKNRLTNPGQILGTAIYMSPEQARDEVLDGRTDVYSLGQTLKHMITSKPPVEGKDIGEIVNRIASTRKLVPIRSIREDLPELFARTIDMMCEPEKERRPNTDEIGSMWVDLSRDGTIHYSVKSEKYMPSKGAADAREFMIHSIEESLKSAEEDPRFNAIELAYRRAVGLQRKGSLQRPTVEGLRSRIQSYAKALKNYEAFIPQDGNDHPLLREFITRKGLTKKLIDYEQAHLKRVVRGEEREYRKDYHQKKRRNQILIAVGASAALLLGSGAYLSSVSYEGDMAPIRQAMIEEQYRQAAEMLNQMSRSWHMAFSGRRNEVQDLREQVYSNLNR